VGQYGPQYDAIACPGRCHEPYLFQR